MLPVGLLMVVVAVLGALALVFVSAKASLEADANGIAKVGMPLGGGKIVSVSVIGGREQKLVPVKVVGSEIVAKQPVPANEALKIRVVIKRPGLDRLAGREDPDVDAHVHDADRVDQDALPDPAQGHRR